MTCVVSKLANVNISIGEAGSGTGVAFMVRTGKAFIALDGLVDPEEERERLEKDLVYYQGFLQSVRKKLGNERFVSGAPAAVIENERKKEADALAKIETIQASLSALK